MKRWMVEVTWFVLLLIGNAHESLASDLDLLYNARPPRTASLDSWTGRIEQDTTWRDTVYVRGDVTIGSGATLTLAPHTAVRFLPYHDETQGGLDATRAELIVAGRLQAQAEGIVFGSADAASWGADWYGIVVERGGRADVSNATIRDGLRCLYAKKGGHVRMDHVAFVNCGKPIGVSQNSTGLPKVLDRRANKEKGAGIRIGKKLAVGGLGSLGGGLVGGLVGVGGLIFFAPFVKAHSTGGGIGVEFYPLIGFWIGDMVGTAASVSWVDAQDHFLITLAGSALAGVGVPAAVVGMTALNVMDENGFEAVFGWAAFFSPVVGATIASELWRKPLSTKLHLKPGARRISVGLVPGPKGDLSAIITLRF